MPCEEEKESVAVSSWVYCGKTVMKKLYTCKLLKKFGEPDTTKGYGPFFQMGQLYLAKRLVVADSYKKPSKNTPLTANFLPKLICNLHTYASKQIMVKKDSQWLFLTMGMGVNNIRTSMITSEIAWPSWNATSLTQ